MLTWLDYHIGFRKVFSINTPRYQDLEKDTIMGCITSSLVIAQTMFEASYLPNALNTFQIADDHQYLDAELAGRIAHTFLAGDQHIKWINHQALVYADLESHPIPTNLTPTDLFSPNVSELSAANAITLPSDPSIHAALHSHASGSSASRKPYQKKKAKSLLTLNKLDKFKNYWSLRLDSSVVRASSLEYGWSQVRLLFRPIVSRAFRSSNKNFIHPCLPPVLPAWREALSHVDLYAQVPTGKNSWKYWVPEAHIVVTSDSMDCNCRYVYNWLKLHDAWYYLLIMHSMQDELIGPLRASQWRDYLNMSERTLQDIQAAPGMKCSKQKRRVLDIFGKVFGNDQLNENIPPLWFGHDMKVAQREEWQHRWLIPRATDNDQLKESECNALLANIFPPHRTLFIKELPTCMDGLASSSLDDRAIYLESLRQVVCRWPGVPDIIELGTPFTLIASEMTRKNWCDKEYVWLKEIVAHDPEVRRLCTLVPPRTQSGQIPRFADNESPLRKAAYVILKAWKQTEWTQAYKAESKAEATARKVFLKKKYGTFLKNFKFQQIQKDETEEEKKAQVAGKLHMRRCISVHVQVDNGLFRVVVVPPPALPKVKKHTAQSVFQEMQMLTRNSPHDTDYAGEANSEDSETSAEPQAQGGSADLEHTRHRHDIGVWRSHTYKAFHDLSDDEKCKLTDEAQACNEQQQPILNDLKESSDLAEVECWRYVSTIPLLNQGLEHSKIQTNCSLS
ncbi:hypothetical protein NM688_g30 [Phlebia brevispora]|uniref:Uncharacterized protein n=1 Tax=Phlebia brevispora TaxID=194682 RepID=A0ACC1TFQ0_9APHY|nr:hypothetical protein NM688_g30 [Phlebia brevispora]